MTCNWHHFRASHCSQLGSYATTVFQCLMYTQQSAACVWTCNMISFIQPEGMSASELPRVNRQMPRRCHRGVAPHAERFCLERRDTQLPPAESDLVQTRSNQGQLLVSVALVDSLLRSVREGYSGLCSCLPQQARVTLSPERSCHGQQMWGGRHFLQSLNKGWHRTVRTWIRDRFGAAKKTKNTTINYS